MVSKLSPPTPPAQPLFDGSGENKQKPTQQSDVASQNSSSNPSLSGLPPTLGSSNKTQLLSAYTKWSPKAPIEVLKRKDALSAIIDLRHQHKTWQQATLPCSVSTLDLFDEAGNILPLAESQKIQLANIRTEHPDMTSEEAASVQEAANWNRRLSFTGEMIDFTNRMLNAFCDKYFIGDVSCVYKLNNRPAAFMLLIRDGEKLSDSVSIEGLFTLPGVRYAASSLIEKAVNLSVQWKKNGKLQTEAAGAEAVEAYRSCGFKIEGITRYPDGRLFVKMTLDVNHNSAWTKQNHQWILTRFADKRYLECFGAKDDDTITEPPSHQNIGPPTE